MPDPKSNGGDSREILTRLVGEYAIKGMIVATACIILMFAVGCFLLNGFREKTLTIEHVIIIAGIGYTAARETYFRGIKGKNGQG